MIVIAGGGIGDLTLGCALSQARKPSRKQFCRTILSLWTSGAYKQRTAALVA
jgi:hypothetical protein